MYQWLQSVPILYIGHTFTKLFFYFILFLHKRSQHHISSHSVLHAIFVLSVFMFVCIFDAFLYLVLVHLGLILHLQYVTSQALLFVVG